MCRRALSHSQQKRGCPEGIAFGLIPLDRGLSRGLPLSPSGSCEAPNFAVLNVMSRDSQRGQGLCFYYALYWGFNPPWTIVALIASVYSFQIVLAKAER